MSAHAEQYSHYRAVRERLFKPATAVKEKPVVIEAPKAPVLLVFRDFDEHVRAWRRWKRTSAAMERASVFGTFSISGSFSAVLAPQSYEVMTCSIEGGTPETGIRRSMHEICVGVLRGFRGVTLAEVKGPLRNRSIVEARFACIYAVRQQRPDLSYPAIGRFFNKDHTSCLHAVNKVKAQREKENA